MTRLSKNGGFRPACGAALCIAIALVAPASADETRWGARVETPQPSASKATSAVKGDARTATQTDIPSGVVLREADIAGLKAALNLTPEQRPHWPAVEAALSRLARLQARTEATTYVQRIKDRASALAQTAAHLRRIKRVAAPLMKSLTEAQKRAAVGFAQRMGYGRLIAMF